MFNRSEDSIQVTASSRDSEKEHLALQDKHTNTNGTENLESPISTLSSMDTTPLLCSLHVYECFGLSNFERSDKSLLSTLKTQDVS